MSIYGQSAVRRDRLVGVEKETKWKISKIRFRFYFIHAKVHLKRCHVTGHVS